jgi:hypothetical protein
VFSHHMKIKSRFKFTDVSYHSIQNLLSFNLLPQDTKLHFNILSTLFKKSTIFINNYIMRIWLQGPSHTLSPMASEQLYRMCESSCARAQKGCCTGLEAGKYHTYTLPAGDVTSDTCPWGSIPTLNASTAQ